MFYYSYTYFYICANQNDIFVTFQQDGRSIAYGEDFKKTVRECYDSNPEQLVAIGANCVAPRLIEHLFKDINVGRKNPMPLIVYPNSGESYNVEQGYEFLTRIN